MPPDPIIDVSLPLAAGSLILLVIRAISQEVRLFLGHRNGGTPADKTVTVLESINAKQSSLLLVSVESGSKLDDMKASLVKLEQHNLTADAVASGVAAALVQADRQRAAIMERDVRNVTSHSGNGG